MTIETIAKLLVAGGLASAGVGGGLLILSRLGLTVGRLPGDLFLEREGLTVYIPIASTLLISLVLTMVVNLFVWLLRK